LSAPAPVSIRPATEADVETIFGLIVELASYERAPEKVVGTPELLRQALFAEPPAAEAVLAERENRVVGFALFHRTFSTWECRPGLWLEDLYVPPEERRGGVGGALFRHVARLAVERDCPRLEWAALDWNTPALSFYEALEAEVLDEWKMHRLSGQSLRRASR
jgi:GNAT superfamily N-acetyltransferase